MLKLTEPWLDNAEVEAVQKVFDSGWLAEGLVTEKFERRVADYVGVKHAVATCNCTVALELCLKALDVKGEVVVPAFTHPGTIQAVLNASVSPVLIDVDLATYNMDIGVKYLGNDTVMPVSWGGNPLEGLPLYRNILEDAACSLGSDIAGVKTGYGWLTCFSFHPRKLITTGEGGMVVTNDAEFADKIRDLKNFGECGGNYKLNDVASAIGLAQMDKLDMIINRRIEMAKIYDNLLGSDPLIQTPQKEENVKHTYQTYAIYLQTTNRDFVIKKLAKEDIETQVGAYALHLLPQFQNVKRIGALKNAELLHHHLLALPMAHSMTDEDQKRVATELRKAVSS